ncbi:MAG: Ig-like domain-containing protein, partial [Paludibacter sp.]
MRKKITILKTMLLAIMMLVGSGNVWGQQLAIYEFTGTSTADNQFNSVTSQPTNATFSNFTRNGVTWVSTADLFNSSTSWGSAINTAKYQTFTITPSSNYKMTLSQISFLQSRTSAGATNWSIRSSVDSYAADIQTGTSSTTGTTVNNSLSGADFTDRTTAITFRIYAWGGSSTGNWKIDNLSVNGIITSQGTPDILLADIGTQVTAANINQGATTQVLSKFQLGITTASASLSGMTCTTSGSYITADITNLKVRYSVDATLDAADATISTYTTPGIAGVKTFPSFVTQSIAMDATGYIFITADIAAGAIHNNTIAVNAISTSNLTFSSGNKTGTASAGGTQTIKDATPPTVTTYSPIDGNTAVTANQSLTLTFNENIQAGTSGDFVIYNTAGIFETIPYNDSRITYATNTVTINPTGTFSLGANYYVQIGNTAISDIAGNLYAGISTTTTWNFTTIAPVVTSVTSSNLDGTYKIGDLITVNVSFSDTVNVTGSPYLLLNMVGTDRQAAYSTGSGTSILNFTYTIQSTDAAADLDYVTTSSLALNSGTINSTDGIAATRTLATPGAANSLGNNKAIVIDAVAPTVSTYSPTDGNTTVLINQNLVFTFNENVKAGTTGSIVIYNSGGTVFETIPYNDDRITFSTNTVTINPIGSLGYSSDYYVQISLGAITDNFDNVYLGISNATTWNFTTECGPVSFPYSQTFTTYPPTCWTEATGLLAAQSTLTGTTSGWIADGYANSGTTGSARLNIYGTTSKEWMITPSIDLGTTTDYQLEFDVALTAYGATTSPAITGTDDKFAVVISTDNGTTWTSTNNLKLWDNAGSSNVYNNLTPTGTHVTISLANYTGIVKIGFYGESTATNADNDLFIDNVAVSVIATCVSPMDVVSSNVTASTATISWTASTSTPTNGYQYELRTSGTAGSGATGLVTSGTTLAGVVSASISGLSDNTSYAVYVRADCSAGDFSVWSTLYNFTTNNVSVPTATAAT